MSLSKRASHDEARTPRDLRTIVASVAACAALLSVGSNAAAQETVRVSMAPVPMRLRDRLEIAGGIVFGVGFLPAAVAGAVMPLAVEPGSPLIQWFPIEAVPIPVFGPALYGASLLTASSCDATCHTVSAVFLADAVVQLAGAVLLIAGPLVDRDPPAPPAPPASAHLDRRVRWNIGLGTANAPLGLSLRIAHF